MTKMVYLCGNIANCDDAECKDWREYAKKRLGEAGVFHEDPLDRDMRGVENFDVHALIAGDKAAIDRCTHLLVHWTRIGVGSAMEIHYGWERKKRIVFVNKAEGPLSPWIKSHVHYITTDLDDGIDFVLNDSVRTTYPHSAS